LADLSQYASSPGRRAYCYTELAISSPTAAKITAVTHCTYSKRDADLSQYASSPDRRAYCYTELAISSPTAAKITAVTHCTYSKRDGQTELAK